MYIISPGKTLINTTALVLGNSIHTHAHTRETFSRCVRVAEKVYRKIACVTNNGWLPHPHSTYIMSILELIRFALYIFLYCVSHNYCPSLTALLVVIELISEWSFCSRHNFLYRPRDNSNWSTSRWSHARALEKQRWRQCGRLEGFSWPRYKRIRS